MNQREETSAMKREAHELNASDLLCKMTHIIYQVNGFEAALRCLRDGAAQNIAMKPHSEGVEYPRETILQNPIPARCTKCKRTFTDEPGRDGNGAIHAPALSGCRCFYCSGALAPLEKGGPVTVEQVEQLNSQEKEQPMLPIY